MKHKRFCHFSPRIDCFGTRINTQLPEYFSKRPDPEAKFIDAFTVHWRPYLCYLFPLFSQVPSVLQKIQVEQVESLIVAPYWPTQAWFSQSLSLAIQELLIYKPSAIKLILPQDPKTKHPLAEKLSLTVPVLSKKKLEINSENKRSNLLASWRPGTLKATQNT